MSATIINIASRSSVAGYPPVARKRAAEIRTRLAAVENHRSVIARRQEINARGRDVCDPPDPIFNAIDAHCAAIASYHMTLAERGDDDAVDRALANECEALRALFSCRPKSLDGTLTLLNHLGQPGYLIYGREETILQEAMAIDEEQGRSFPLMLEETIRSVIIAICSRPSRRRRRK